MHTRRAFLRVSVVGMPLLLSACATPQTPASPTTGPTTAPASATSVPAPAAAPKPTLAPKPTVPSKDPLPAYLPFTAGPKPDFHHGVGCPAGHHAHLFRLHRRTEPAAVLQEQVRRSDALPRRRRGQGISVSGSHPDSRLEELCFRHRWPTLPGADSSAALFRLR